MRQYVTVDVVDRPVGGALAAIRRLRRITSPPACLALIPCATGHFVERTIPRPTPRRVGLIAAWTDLEAARHFAERGEGVRLAAGAREHWHVSGVLARAVGEDSWRGWMPEAGDAAPPADDEPLLVLISGELRPRALPEFLRDAGRSVRHAHAQPGYLGGLALQSSPTNTTSCSAWRTAADSRAYAFKPGGHADAMKHDRAHANHLTERFLRIRPIATSGSLDGRDPFAGVAASGPLPTVTA